MSARRGPCGHVVIMVGLLMFGGALAWVIQAAVGDLTAGRTC